VLQDAVERLEDTRGIGRAIRYYRGLRAGDSDVSETVGRRLADGGLPEAELSERRLRTVLDEVPTVSGKRPLIRNLRRVDADLGDLNEVQTRRLSRLLARTDEDGVRLVNDLDNLEGDQIQTFLSTEEIDGFNSFSEWDQWRKSIATSYNRPEVEQSEVSNYIENIRQAGILRISIMKSVLSKSW